MIISLLTTSKKLEGIFKIPLLGSFVVFLIAAAPVPLLFILNAIFEFTSTPIIERFNALVACLWNVILTFLLRTRIGILFIPCWILFGIIGLLRAFQIIGS